METVAILTRPCGVCHEDGVVHIPAAKRDAYVRWQREHHAPIQTILPELSAEEREMLITGIHPACWQELWAYLDDEEDIDAAT